MNMTRSGFKPDAVSLLGHLMVAVHALRRLFVLPLVLVSGAALAATLEGLIVGIQDGDTLTLLDDARIQHRVRLSGIDAPEKRQAFGDRSRETLGSMVFRKRVTVEWSKLDRYGRIVGKVIFSGKDVNLEQIRLGHAWHYKQYAREQSMVDQAAYDRAEQIAREGRTGLWRDANPVPPWSFRKNGPEKRLLSPLI